MSGPYTGVCSPWATTDDICAPCDGVDFSAGLIDDRLDVASDLLFELSGRRWPGICTDYVRPCTRAAADEYRGKDGLFHVACGCAVGRRCGCSRVNEVTLGAYPLISVDQVKVDGATLDPARYRVDDYRWLVRLPDADGTTQAWPCWQRLDLPTTERDTFEVRFTYGAAPPAAGRVAAARLACEMALACDPESASKCQLSQRVQSVVRQGVTVVLDRLDAFREGLTGIPDIDLFLTTYNPAKLRRRARVLSPDTGTHARRADT